MKCSGRPFRSTAAAFALGSMLLASGCASRADSPAGFEWGLPVYPHTSLVAKNASKASFALYHTSDSVKTVTAWYESQLPGDAQRAIDTHREQATFALFDKGSRRTVHIQREGSTTSILLTKLITR